MESTEVNQHCICSLNLAPECPAHPYRTRLVKTKPTRRDLKGGKCPACVFIKEAEHRDGRHMLYAADVPKALAVGVVFCLIPKLSDQPLVVRGANRKDGVPAIEVLEGSFTGVPEIWMDVRL